MFIPTLVIGKGGKGSNGGDPPKPRRPRRPVQPITREQRAHLLAAIQRAIDVNPVTFQAFSALCYDRDETANDRIATFTDLLTGDWRADTALVDIFGRWDAMRRTDCTAVQDIVTGLTEDLSRSRILDGCAQLSRHLTDEQAVKLSAVILKDRSGVSAGAVKDDDDSRVKRLRAVVRAYPTLADQQQNDLAAIVVALASPGANGSSNASVRSLTLRFIRHVLGLEDIAAIAKSCIDALATADRKGEK